jgi:hypothetical protein
MLKSPPNRIGLSGGLVSATHAAISAACLLWAARWRRSGTREAPVEFMWVE